MKFISAKELSETNPEPVTWICKPWLPLEAITELDGKAKAAGKTTFTLAMCKAVLNGEQFLGEPTTQSAIVYLTEESTPTFRIALDRAGIGTTPDLHILFWRETHQVRERDDLGSVWEQIVNRAVKHAEAKKAKVLIVDTFAQFARLTGDKENSAGDVLTAMLPIQEARDAGLAVLVIRHERKEGGSVGESGRGSTAMSGAVDIILRLHKPEGKHPPNYRQIDALSRFDETPGELMIALNEDGNGYEVLGDTSAVALQMATDKVLNELPSNAEDAITLEDLRGLTGGTRSTLQLALSGLEAAGLVGKEGEGRKGSPHRFYRNSAETPSP